MTTRRAFLKVAAGLAAGLGLTKYAEPLLAISDQGDWIEDRGSFVILRVPDGKSFANEVINKPAIVLLGVKSAIRDTSFNSYMNIKFSPNSIAESLKVDTTTSYTERARSSIVISGEGGNFRDSQIVSGPRDLFALDATEMRGTVLKDTWLRHPCFKLVGTAGTSWWPESDIRRG